MITLPSTLSRLVDLAGRIVSPWNSYLQQFTQAPAPAIPLTVGASPFAYTALEPGSVAIDGGTVTAVFITRGTAIANITGSRMIQLGINDILTITYSVLPTMTFFPSLGIAPQ